MDNESLNQINEIFEFLKNPKTRLDALNTVLGLTENEAFRFLLLKSDVCRIMIRLLESDNQNSSLILQIIINLSADEIFQKKFIELNTIYRIITLFFQNIDNFKSTPKEENSKDFEAKIILDKYILNPITEVKKNDPKDFTEVPFYLMALTNLTCTEEGQKKYLNVEDEKVKGVRFLQMMDHYLGNVYLTEFDFFSNIIANVSALKEGRFVLLEYKIFKVLLGNIDKLNNIKVLNTLRMIRNCCFEWEHYDTDIMCYDGRLFDYILKILYITNLSRLSTFKYDSDFLLNLDTICFPNFSIDQASNEKDIINDLIIDIFLILTNSVKCIEIMKEKKTKQIIEKLISIFDNPNDSIKDRLFVICNYLQN